MQWKVIEEFPYYEVSEYGDIRRIKTGKIIKPVDDRGYHLYVLPRRGKKRKAARAHTLVLKAFVGPKPFPEAEACHNDGKRDHNHYSNLRWDTQAANHADKLKHGTAQRSSAPRTPELDAEIKALLLSGRSQRAVAERVNVSKTVIGRIALTL